MRGAAGARVSARLATAGEEAWGELGAARRAAGMRRGPVSVFVTPAAQSIPP